MQRLDDRTVELTEDEQIMGDFVLYLMERGMTRHQAIVYLANVSSKVDDVLNVSFRDYLMGEE